MKKKTILVSTLVILGAGAAYSQTTTITLNGQPSRSIGQPQLFPESGAINRVEGRELYNPQGVALDTSTSTPAVYVADLRNNRVLGWKNATGFSNGAPADLVIGQPDQFSTGTQGPSGTFVTGLAAPTGLAVDSNGNLYVADSGNNRILRYPKPFNQQGQVTPDLWLGQPSINTRTSNYTGAVSANGLYLATSNNVLQANMAFDSSGNLWVVDPGNSRVIRFPASNLSCSNCTAKADIVVGQTSLTTTQTPALQNTPSGVVIGNQFGLPTAIAFDSKGHLYVSDAIGSQGRVLVFLNPTAQSAAASADRIMGVIQQPQLGGLTTQDQINQVVGKTLLYDPTGIFFLPDDSVGVVDAAFSRILIFPPYAQWPAQSTYYSPQANAVVGQTDFPVQTNANANGIASGSTAITPPPSNTTLWGPTSAAYLASTKELFVTDTYNNRMVVLPQSGSSFGGATRVLGQDLFNQYSPNLVEGKEFDFQIGPPYNANGTSIDAGMALDTTGTVPHLWVADPYNHRVLGFKDARTLSPSSVADIVIGQPGLQTALCNYPKGDPAFPSQSSLCRPYGVAVDTQGNLYVADSGNGRVLRFPNPFASGVSYFEQADVVLGQHSFTNSVLQPTNSTMSAPYGLAFTGKNGLVVSDVHDNRVLYIPFTNGTFTGNDNGKAFAQVYGQTNFTNVTSPAGTGLNQMNAPHHIACDTSGQVYVTDTGNGRILIFGDPSNAQTFSGSAILSLPGLNAPRGIYVNSGTGEIWVANTNSGTLIRYPKYDTLYTNPAPTATITDVVNNTAIPTLAVAQDQYGDLFVADLENRVAVFYQGFATQNAATYLPVSARALAPGMMASLYPLASATQFGSTTATVSTSTWPTTLGNIQVTFNGTPAPLQYVSPGQINFYVPMSAQPNTNAEVEVIQGGQILGAQQVPITTVAPGIYTTCQSNQSGSLREACILNQDNSVNSASNPAARGSVIQIFGTGQGLVSNPPADGVPAGPSTPYSTTLTQPRVIIGSCFVDDCGALLPGDVGTSSSVGTSWVPFSGLAPNYVGLWQVNVQIPMATAPGSNPIAIQLNGVASSDATSGFHTIFYVK